MKIAVVGAGGVGGPFGARLAQGGNDVTFIARGAHLAAMQKDGLRIEGALGNVHLTPTQATDDPKTIGVCDIVIFCVKQYDVESAGEHIRPIVGPHTGIIPIQNGIDAADRLRPILGDGHVMGGVALINASIASPGVITQPGNLQSIIFGELDGSRSARAEAFLGVCQASKLDANLTSDIQVELWKKYIFLVAISSVTAATRKTLGNWRDDPDVRPLYLDVAREVTAVARAQGIAIPDGFAEERDAALAKSPDGTIASMAVDLIKGNRMELPWLAGRVVAMGRELGVPTPVTRVLHAILKPYQNGTPA
jgi:2-dehydropantoate 2-reductase